MSEYLLKIQKNIYVITLASAAIFGLSVAYFIANLIPFFLSGSAIQVTAAGASRRLSQRSPAQTFRSVENFYTIASGNLVRDTAINANAEEVASSGPPSAGGDITVLGMISGSPSFAMAAIQVDGEPAANEYRVNEVVAGFKILAIENRKLVVEKSGQKYSIGVGESSKEIGGSRSEGSPGDNQISGEGPKTSGRADKTISITRDKMLSLTRDQAEIYKNKFTPVIKNGEMLGLRLIFVPNDNFLYELGARSGDIIRRINGEPLKNNEKLMEFYQSLKTTDSVTVDLERGGKIVSYNIVIR